MWHSVHVFYHEPDKDPLLLDAVRPLLADIRDHVEAAYVVRHWRQGPHLRINVKTDRRTWEEVVRPRVGTVVGGWLRDHPSTYVVDQAESLARHRLMAAREQEHGPLTPWPADNSIVEFPFDDRRHVLGGDEGVDLLTAFYSDSTPLLFAMLDHCRDGRDTKSDLAMALLLTVAHTSHPIERSYLSFRVHAEGYLTWSRDPEAARRSFDEVYGSRRALLTQRVRQVVDTIDAGGDSPFVREWAALVETYRARADRVVHLLPAMDDTPAETRGELHTLMFGTPGYRRDMFARPDFLRYRVVLNYTYLHLTRLGLTPLDRFRTCHLLANAVEEVYGVSGLESMRRYASG
ncbi:thiopeptide maturation pyridine synthase [Streptosporangium sp. NPDC023963]|uniref:thiopeptide maturation pyridine synthase n=1 Tax=Streptosporangium sp. NPDC023963 TaxID=3155608 RepID=UPI00342A7071